MANFRRASRAASVSDSSRRQASTSGGRSETELTALAVVPNGRPSGSRVVITVTPVANIPIAPRSRSASTPAMRRPGRGRRAAK